MGQVRGQVKSQVGDQVWGQVGDQVRDQVRDQVWGQVGDQVWDQVWGQVLDQVYGSMDASWICFYDYFINETKVENLENVKGLIEMSKHCGWWTPLKDVVIFQHRPKNIHLDDRGRLHNEHGAAIEYRGMGLSNVWAIHGVRTSEKVITRQFDWKDIDSEKNVEVRRIMIDLYGQSKYIEESGLKPVHTDDFGTLYRKEFTGDETLVVVKVINSTPEPDGSYKDYWLRVDPNAYGGVKTALDAVASTWRNSDGSMIFDSPQKYQPDIQT